VDPRAGLDAVEKRNIGNTSSYYFSNPYLERSRIPCK
jgi:hypothetical protein